MMRAAIALMVTLASRDLRRMRLLDLIAQGRCARLESEEGQMLPTADRFATTLRECPVRYVLSDELATCATQLAYAEGDRLSACMDLIRVPARSVWVEWADYPRQQALQDIPLLGARCEVVARRAGVLVSAAADCRSGQLRTFWSMADELAYVSPVVTQFDFERSPGLPAAGSGDSEWAAAIQLKEEPAIDELLQHLRFHFDAGWSAYFAARCSTADLRSEALHANLSSCAFDAPMLMGFFLLLNATSLLPRREVRHDPLNRARLRAGKPPLLEHIEVTAPLNARPLAQDRLADCDSGRSSPRLHHVRGHIVRRGSAVYWRSPHLRGSARLGQVRSRTVTLSFARAESAAAG